MYIVEGNIGAGKTTFLTLLQEYLPELTVQLEPVNNWQKDIYGQSLLSSFYEQPKRWAYSMETFAMICRVQEHIQRQQNNELQVIERSIYSGHYVFAVNGYKQGFMSELEWKIYLQWFKFIMSKCMPPQGFIYLSVDPEVAFERIKKRKRDAESAISFDYLKQIDQQHKEFLLDKQGVDTSIKDVPVLVLDCNQEFQEDASVMQKHVEAIKLFLMPQKPKGSLSVHPPV